MADSLLRVLTDMLQKLYYSCHASQVVVVAQATTDKIDRPLFILYLCLK